MFNKKFSYPLLLLFLILLLSACSNSSDEENTETSSEVQAEDSDQTEDAADQETDSVSSGQITGLDGMEADDPASGNFDIVNIEKGPFPNPYPWKFGDYGIFILENEDRSLFYDYLEGTHASLTTDIEELQSDAERGNISRHNAALTDIFDGSYYFVDSLPSDPNEPYGEREWMLLELDMVSRDITAITPEESIATIAMHDNVLFIGNTERIYAVDLETNEILWENDTGIVSSWIPNFFTTDNSLVFTSMETTVVYSQETGEIIYEEPGYIYDVATDGEMFYALENVSEGVDDEIQIVAYHETDGKEEGLTDPVVIDHVYRESNVDLDLVNDRLFITMENGILAYDANTFDHLWTNAYGTIEDSDTDNYDYYIDAVYNGDYAYMYTEALGNSDFEDMNLFTVIDAATGEVLESYDFGTGSAAGPFYDELNEKVFVYYYESEEGKAYIIDAK